MTTAISLSGGAEPSAGMRCPPHRGLVPTLTLATFIDHLTLIAWYPLLPFMAPEFGVSVALLGQMPGLIMLVSTPLGLVIGPLADRYGYRHTLAVCLLAVVAANLAIGFAAALSVLVLATLAAAVGRGAIMPVAQAIVARSFIDETARRHAVSRTQNGRPLAATAGILLLTTTAAALQWRAAFILLAALALAEAFILWRILCRDGDTGGRPLHLHTILAAYRPLVRHRACLTLIGAAALEQAGVWAMWTYYGAFYVQQYGFSAQQVGWVSVAAGLGALLGQSAAGGRFGGHPRSLFVCGCLCAGPLIGLSVMLPLPAAAAVALVIGGFLMHGAITVVTVVLVVSLSPAGRATTLTFYGSAMNLGIALGAALGGLALARADYAALGLCTLALPLVSAALVWWRVPEPEKVPE